MTAPLSSVMWVMTGSVIGSLGAVGLKAGAHRLEFNIRGLVTNWELILGGLGYALSTVFFVAGLRHGELSVLYPMVSVGYIWSTLWSKIFFKEPITKVKIVALAVILCGVGLLLLDAL
jgi:drug/metabolite transporter (DMT)-like permease